MKLFGLLLVLAAACNGSSTAAKQEPTPSHVVRDDGKVTKLRQNLATAKEQARHAIGAEDLPIATDVRALVDADSRPWWESFTPLENFLLFEMSPKLAARAPTAVRAEALCAGVGGVISEFWSIPGGTSADATQHALSLGAPVAQCLVKLFDSTQKLVYDDGEASIHAETHHWTVGDLAAGIVALHLGETYDASAEPDVRAARRTELRAKIK